MISEAIDNIRKIADESSRVQELNQLSSADRVAFFNPKSGLVFYETKDITPRSHTVISLESLTDAVSRFGDSDDSSAWISMKQVIVILNDTIKSRRDSRISMQLKPHGAFDVFASPKWMNQKAIINLLKHDLADCVIGPEETLNALKSLKFATQQESTGKITATTAAMGKSIAAQVTGEIDLPETVSFEFHPFPGLGDELEVNAVVYCTLFSDPLEELLMLSPKPGSIEEATRKALTALKARIGEFMPEECVLLGTP